MSSIIYFGFLHIFLKAHPRAGDQFPFAKKEGVSPFTEGSNFHKSLEKLILCLAIYSKGGDELADISSIKDSSQHTRPALSLCVCVCVLHTQKYFMYIFQKYLAIINYFRRCVTLASATAKAWRAENGY